jgi:SAM-dependent methyltransferase
MAPMPLPPQQTLAGERTVERPERTSTKSRTRIRFELDWESTHGRHTDCLVATTLDLWRDLFPRELEREIMDQPVGHRASHSFAPGELVRAWRERHLFRVGSGQFNVHYVSRGRIPPRTGRFYPKGILEGVDGVLRTDRGAFRVVGIDGDGILADFNHPLAGKSLRLTTTVEDIRTRGEERGGSCKEIGELVCADGPGMQARWRGLPTDFWSDTPYLRIDPRPDAEFYAKPRLVDHLDRAAITEISALYGRLLPKGSRILDLMSSWHSHLPTGLKPGLVTGLGMNGEELAANPVLGERLVQDLNRDPALPFADGAFDAVVCTVSVEYLTKPFEIFREIARVLRPGGRFVATFSNRWFPPKVTRIWAGIHEFERLALVSEYFLESGLFENLATWSLRGVPRPEDDKYADRLLLSDPVYAVWAERVAP